MKILYFHTISIVQLNPHFTFFIMEPENEATFMTKKSNSSYLNQLLKPQKLPKKEIKPVSYYIEPEEVSSKILYSIQDLDPFLSQLESLNLFQEENENPDFYLDPKTIQSKKKRGQKIYRFVKKFDQTQIELKDQDDQLFLILDHQSVGVIDKTKARDLFSLYTKQSFESLTAFVYGGETKCLQEDQTFKRENLDHMHYKIDLILTKQESSEEKEQRRKATQQAQIDQYKQQQLAYVKLVKQAEKNTKTSVSEKDWKIVSIILILLVVGILVYICLSSINQILF